MLGQARDAWSPRCRRTTSAGWWRTSSARAASTPRTSSGASSTASAATPASASTSPRRASASARRSGCSDRGHSAASQIRPGEVNWDKLFGEEGVRWFHTGGIFAALATNTVGSGDRGGARPRASTAPSSPTTSTTAPRCGRARAARKAAQKVNRTIAAICRRDDRQRGGLHRLPRLRGRGAGRAHLQASIRRTSRR